VSNAQLTGLAPLEQCADCNERNQNYSKHMEIVKAQEKAFKGRIRKITSKDVIVEVRFDRGNLLHGEKG